jgi:hypothetical protein
MHPIPLPEIFFDIFKIFLKIIEYLYFFFSAFSSTLFSQLFCQQQQAEVYVCSEQGCLILPYMANTIFFFLTIISCTIAIYVFCRVCWHPPERLRTKKVSSSNLVDLLPPRHPHVHTFPSRIHSIFSSSPFVPADLDALLCKKTNCRDAEQKRRKEYERARECQGVLPAVSDDFFSLQKWMNSLG